MGRKSIGDKPLTNAEKQRLKRKKLALNSEVHTKAK